MFSFFLGKLKEFCFKPTDILISFDVVSLFTNVPLEQTINTIADHIYELYSRPPFEKKTFKKLMHIATSGIFMYRDRYFRQVDGKFQDKHNLHPRTLLAASRKRGKRNVVCTKTIAEVRSRDPALTHSRNGVKRRQQQVTSNTNSKIRISHPNSDE